jgi:hypothetical protein
MEKRYSLHEFRSGVTIVWYGKSVQPAYAEASSDRESPPCLNLSLIKFIHIHITNLWPQSNDNPKTTRLLVTSKHSIISI